MLIRSVADREVNVERMGRFGILKKTPAGLLPVRRAACLKTAALIIAVLFERLISEPGRIHGKPNTAEVIRYANAAPHRPGALLPLRHS